MDKLLSVINNRLFKFEELNFKAQEYAIKFYNDTMSCAFGIEYNDESTPYILADENERIYNYKGETVGY